MELLIVYSLWTGFRTQARSLHVPRCPFVALAQNLKPHDDENEGSDNDSKFDAFAEELDSNWYDLIAYGKTYLLTG